MLREYLPPPLSDRDNSTLEQLSLEELTKLANEALARLIKDSPATIRERIGHKQFPTPPPLMRLDHLDLEARTHNCLVQAGFYKHLNKLGEWTVSQILALPNFGVRSLRDLLVSLDSALARHEQGTTFADNVQNSRLSAQPEDRTPNSEDDGIINQETMLMIRMCCEQKVSLPSHVGGRRLPLLLEGLKMDKLDLKTRTLNCLKDSGLLERLQELGGKTINELLTLPNFGKDSLLNLLTELEPYFIRGTSGTDIPNAEFTSFRGPEQIRLLRVPGESYQLSLAAPTSAADSSTQGEITEQMLTEARLLKQTPGAELIYSDDPRFGKLLLAVDASAENARAAAERILVGEHIPHNQREATERLRKLRERISDVSNIKLEEELKTIALSVTSERRWEIAARRLGLDGRGGITLEAVGQEFKLTRERVRQICARFAKGFEGKSPFAPALDRVLNFVSERLNDSTDELQSELVQAGLSESSFSLEGLPEIAVLFGREIDFAITRVGTKSVVMALATDPLAKLIFRTARRAIRVWGVATMADVSAQAAEQSPLSVETISRALIAQPDFHWLDEATGWFWLSSVPRNRLLNRIRKILSVAGQVDVSELRGGVGRDDRMEGFAPPQRVILELCCQVSWCRVENKMVRAEPPLDWREELPESEQVLVCVLREYERVMRREKLEAECLRLGMNQATFYKYLSYLPFITKYAPGVYGLRGAVVPPGLVESLTPKIRRGKVLMDYGWTADGRVWSGYQLSENLLFSGVCSVPSALKNFLQGEFALKAPDGSNIGTMVVSRTSAWGLRPLFSRRGGEAGDYLILLFNLAEKVVVAYLGDANILDEFQANEEFAVSTPKYT
jgi:hypothetical protein